MWKLNEAAELPAAATTQVGLEREDGCEGEKMSVMTSWLSGEAGYTERRERAKEVRTVEWAERNHVGATSLCVEGSALPPSTYSYPYAISNGRFSTLHR